MTCASASCRASTGGEVVLGAGGRERLAQPDQGPQALRRRSVDHLRMDASRARDLTLSEPGRHPGRAFGVFIAARVRFGRTYSARQWRAWRAIWGRGRACSRVQAGMDRIGSAAPGRGRRDPWQGSEPCDWSTFSSLDRRFACGPQVVSTLRAGGEHFRRSSADRRSCVRRRASFAPIRRVPVTPLRLGRRMSQGNFEHAGDGGYPEEDWHRASLHYVARAVWLRLSLDIIIEMNRPMLRKLRRAPYLAYEMHT
jgi:hypothetical protein